MLRFKLEDLPLRLREQAVRQLSPHGESVQTQPRRKVRPPITMVRKNGQSSAETAFNSSFLGNRGKFEALTLRLPGGSRYTPDFLVTDWQMFPGSIVLVEVKGSYRLKSHSRAATAFKTACAVFPEFVFCWAEQETGGRKWRVSFFQNGEQVGECEEMEAN